MMNNSKSKHSNGNDHSKSKPHGKRKPIRNTSNEDTVETVYVESNHVPLVIPKWEKPDTQRKSFHLARDPRMTSNPIMERDDDMDEDISNEAFPPDLTNNELVHTAEFLQSIIDINVENVKSEKDYLGLGETDDWKIQFWSEANTTTEEDRSRSKRCVSSSIICGLNSIIKTGRIQHLNLQFVLQVS
jgi:hypothetical protein